MAKVLPVRFGTPVIMRVLVEVPGGGHPGALVNAVWDSYYAMLVRTERYELLWWQGGPMELPQPPGQTPADPADPEEPPATDSEEPAESTEGPEPGTGSESAVGTTVPAAKRRRAG